MDDSEKNMCPMIDKAISESLTDNRTANALRDNTEGLLAAGIEPDMSHLRYIKLNRYEQREELSNDLFKKFMTDVSQDMSEIGNIVRTLLEYDLVKDLTSTKELSLGDPAELSTIETIKAIEEEITNPTATIRGQHRNAIAIEDAIPNLEDTKCK